MAPSTVAARFATGMAVLAARLPFGAGRIVDGTVLGYLVINGTTFAIDLSLLTGLHGGLGWPLPLAITLGYGTAFGLSYLLNRVLNFRSHGDVGAQLVIYVPVVVVNYLVWILGVGDGLAAAGLDYRLARVLAGLGEAVYMYSALRWLVFRRRADRDGTNATPGRF